MSYPVLTINAFSGKLKNFSKVIFINQTAILIHVAPAFQVTLFYFYERSTLVPVYTNQKKSEEICAFMKNQKQCQRLFCSELLYRQYAFWARVALFLLYVSVALAFMCYLV